MLSVFPVDVSVVIKHLTYVSPHLFCVLHQHLPFVHPVADRIPTEFDVSANYVVEYVLWRFPIVDESFRMY